MRLPLPLLALLLAAPMGALAEGRAAVQELRLPVRLGEHPGFGRLVFDWPGAPDWRAEPQEGRLLLRFPAGVTADLPQGRRPPRNVAAINAMSDGVAITLRPGAHARTWRLGNRLVVDVADPAPGGTASEAAPTAARIAAPAARATPPRRAMPEASSVVRPPASAAVPPRQAAAEARMHPVRLSQSQGGVPPAAPHAARPASSTAALPGNAVAVVPLPTTVAPPLPIGAGQAETSGTTVLPPAVGAWLEPAGRRAEPDPAILPEAAALPVVLRELPDGRRALLLPLPPDTAAAVLRRGDSLYALFDSPVPLDLAALRQEPLFAAAESRVIPGGVLLRLPLAVPAELLVRRVGEGWLLLPQRPEDRAEDFIPPRPLALEFQPGPPPRLALLTARPGRVLTLSDPETGLALLVAPLRQHGEAVPLARRLPQFDFLPTILGAALLARADNLVMQAGNDRFLLAGAGGTPLSLDAEAVTPPGEARAMTRLFDLPSLPPARLQERLKAQQAGIAAAPPLGRAPLRREAAETLLALGLPQEAQAMLSLALHEDPLAAEDAVSQALGGVAALLGGRLTEARGLLAEGLPESDELALWRAVLTTAQGEGVAAAPTLAATLPLLLDYPEGLKARLLQPVAEALAEAGQGVALRRLSDAAGEAPNLALARAIQAEADGRHEEALALHAEVAAGRDRLARSRALRRSVEMRLRQGHLDATGAAQALEATLFAWRGDAQETLNRRRIAELRRQAGDARGAMALLRESMALFPEQAEALRPDLLASFRLALEREPPLAAVALYDAYPELRPEGEEATAMAMLLAERLLALDLPDRAIALLRRAPAQSRVPAQQARLGLLLARASLAEGDAAGALAALQAVPEPADPAQRQELTLLQARAEAWRDGLPRATELLRGLGKEGDAALAELLAEAQDWPGAAAAQARYLGAALPDLAVPLTPGHSRALLRQAALMALAGDEAGLAALRLGWQSRMSGGPLAEAFQALTSDGLRGLADLPRLQQELQVFRALPTRLEALRTGGPVTR